MFTALKHRKLNCAKILTFNGRASLLSRDKDTGFKPFVWCLRNGYCKDDVAFLTPLSRFYRTAKLTSALYRSRSSISCIASDSCTTVTSSKSLDSIIDDKTKEQLSIFTDFSNYDKNRSFINLNSSLNSQMKDNLLDVLDNERSTCRAKLKDKRENDVMNVFD